MKQIIGTILSLCFILCTVISGNTATWIEDFNDEQFDSWKKHDLDNRTTWQPKDGRLDVWIEPRPRILLQDFTLEFVGFPLNEERLRVKLTVLKTHSQGIGILIGQHTPDGGISRRTYSILQKSFWTAIEFPKRLGNNPLYYPDLDVIEIVFDKGHLQLLSGNDLVFEFHEPNLQTIDCIGITTIITQQKFDVLNYVLDDFIISGPTVPTNGSQDVQPKDKVAVLWGRLKQQ